MTCILKQIKIPRITGPCPINFLLVVPPDISEEPNSGIWDQTYLLSSQSNSLYWFLALDGLKWQRIYSENIVQENRKGIKKENLKQECLA